MQKKTFEILRQVQTNKIFVNLTLKQLNYDENIMKNITIRVYGILENYLFLKYKVEEVTKDKKLDEKTMLICMMAVYEKEYLDNVPDYAIISNYTNLCSQVNHKSKKYISFFLNNKLCEAAKAVPCFSNQLKNDAIIYSLPLWIVKTIEAQYGDEYLIVLKSLIGKKKITARVVNNLEEAEKFETFLFEDFVYCRENIIKSKDFNESNIVIQDLGSYLVTIFSNAHENDLVADLCAAPGNKTMHLSTKAKKVVSNEINKKRYLLLKSNLEKFNIENVETINCDATDKKKLLIELNGQKFDKIVIDAPCSGWGAFKSKPEMKLYQNQEEIKSIIAVQYLLLEGCLPLLKEGGEIIYSTCTLNKEENSKLVSRAMKELGLIEIKEQKIIKLCQSTEEIGITLKPCVYNTDGFYMCKLKKEDNEKHI